MHFGSTECVGRADRFRANSLRAVRREFVHKPLDSQMFSTQIFAKSGRIDEIPCIFPCQQGILTIETK
jgi:hypothetical protein